MLGSWKAWMVNAKKAESSRLKVASRKMAVGGKKGITCFFPQSTNQRINPINQNGFSHDTGMNVLNEHDALNSPNHQNFYQFNYSGT
jgi:hypothetical protein